MFGGGGCRSTMNGAGGLASVGGLGWCLLVALDGQAIDTLEEVGVAAGQGRADGRARVSGGGLSAVIGGGREDRATGLGGR